MRSEDVAHSMWRLRLCTNMWCAEGSRTACLRVARRVEESDLCFSLHAEKERFLAIGSKLSRLPSAAGRSRTPVVRWLIRNHVGVAASINSLIRVNLIACSLSVRPLSLLTSLHPLSFSLFARFSFCPYAPATPALNCQQGLSCVYTVHGIVMSSPKYVLRTSSAVPIPCGRKLGRQAYEPTDKTVTSAQCTVRIRQRGRSLEGPRSVSTEWWQW